MGDWSGKGNSTTTTEAIIEESTAKITTTTQAKIDNNGKANAEITEKQLADAITSVIVAAKKAGEDIKTSVTIDVKFNSKAKELVTKLPTTVLKEAVKQKIDEIKISSQMAEIILSKDTLESIAEQSKGSNISISVGKVKKETLNEVARTIVGDRPIFDFNISSGDKKVSSFDGNEIELTVPYTLTEGENSEKIVIYYIDDNGNIQTINNCEYDGMTKTIRFKTKHLSYYAVGYEQFDDIVNHWAKESINYVYGKNLFNGTTAYEFGPNQSMTRGMFITVIGRLAKADIKDTATGFSDVSQTDYYAPYIKWAVDNKLVSGMGNNIFAPNQAITREEMAVILANYMKMLGNEVNIQSFEFNDEEKISIWAKESIKLIQSLGLIQGKGNNNFDPKATSTRAEVAIIIQRLLSK